MLGWRTYTLLPLSNWSKGAQGESKAQVWPSFRGFLLANGWDSQGNPPSTPAPVIWPSMCQSRRPRWQAHDDTAIVLSPVVAAWASQTPENIPVIMAFQCHLACWVWPQPWRLTEQRQHGCEILRVYWEGLRFLAHKSPVVFDETCLWKRAIRSHLLPSKDREPWVETVSKIARMHTHKTTSAETSTAFSYWQKIAFFYKQRILKVHIPTPLPSLKMAFSFFQLSGGNPFLGPSQVERTRENNTSDNRLAWKWAPRANKFREKITVLHICVNMHVKR